MNAIPPNSVNNNIGEAAGNEQPRQPAPEGVSERAPDRALDRVFRRSRAARARRAKADKSDFRFISLILQLSVMLSLGLVALAILAQNQLSGPAQSRQGSWVDAPFLQDISLPWIGSLSKLDVGGIVFIMLVSLALLWRWRRR